MANVSIKFNGKEFILSCDDGQEEHLEELLIQINQKFNDLKNNLGNLLAYCRFHQLKVLLLKPSE